MSGAASIPFTVANALSERAFQAQVVQLATLCGWRHFHDLNARGSDPGWPDLVLCRPPKLLIVELKSERGKLTDAQRAWLQTLQMCDVDARCWKPSDWPEIEATLGRKEPAIGP